MYAKTRCRAVWLPLMMGLVLLAGCRTPEAGDPGVKGARGEIRFHNWWNFYERGRQALAENRVADAQADFEVCLGVRPGARYAYPEEQWNVRTYGMHSVRVYFPHRELGICRYLQGDLGGAVQYLEQSLAITPSGRAKHYLNLARQKLGQTMPAAPPVIEMAPATLIEWCRFPERTVAGVVHAAAYAQEVTVNGKPIFLELAGKEVRFAETVPLVEGVNDVVVAAVDLQGKRTERRVTWLLDRQPPALSIEAVRTEAGQVILDGLCTDDFALDSILIDGAPAPSTPSSSEAQRSFHVSLSRGLPHRLEALDKAGNRLTAVLPESLDSVWRWQAGPALAGAGYGHTRIWSDTRLYAAAAAVGAGTLATAPEIRLSGADAVAGAYRPEFCVSGSVGDDEGVASVRVNDRELLPRGIKAPRDWRFGYNVPLALGTNRVTVTAVDTRGSRASRTLTVVRYEAAFVDDRYRLSLAVPPVEGGTADLSLLLKRLVEQGLLARQPNRFVVLERGTEAWLQLLQELHLSLSNISDPGAALRIGRLVPADLLLVLSVISEPQGLSVYARAVDMAQGRILQEFDVYVTDPTRDVRSRMDGLVLKVESGFPMIQGRVVENTGRSVRIDVGSSKGLHDRAKLIAMRGVDSGGYAWPEEVYEVNGKPVILAVKQVFDDAGIVTIDPPEAARLLRAGDFICTR